MTLTLHSSISRMAFRETCRRNIASNSLNRASPPPLPRELQREFEELCRRTLAPLAPSSLEKPDLVIDLTVHPDSQLPIKPEFEGSVNPRTGEEGGPKREPVGRWGEESYGDWSFKGRVSDF